MTETNPSLSILSPLSNGVLTFFEAGIEADSEVVSNVKVELPAGLLTAHANRQRDWKSGRLALSKALSEFQIPAFDLTADLSSPQTYAALPGYRFSISHTSGGAGCWLLHDPSNRYSIGLDLETKGRTLAPAVAGKFRNQRDALRDDLRLWCAKEAIYKTLRADLQTRIRFSEIVIVSEIEFTAGALTGQLQLIDFKSWIGALAWSERV